MNSFFAGIGGFDLGFENGGFKVGYICEINDYCNKVLDMHWTDAPRGQDNNEVKPTDLPKADAWCAASLARTYLWHVAHFPALDRTALDLASSIASQNASRQRSPRSC